MSRRAAALSGSQLEAVAERGDRPLELVEDLRALFGGHGFGMFAGQPARFLAGERPQVEVGRGGQSLVVREAGLQVPFPWPAPTSPLRCAAQAWSNAAIAALAASLAVELLAGGREPVPRLVELALAIQAQPLAHRARAGSSARLTPARTRQGQASAVATGAARLTGPRRPILSARRRGGSSPGSGRLDRARDRARERIGQQGQDGQREEDLELVRRGGSASVACSSPPRRPWRYFAYSSPRS